MPPEGAGAYEDLDLPLHAPGDPGMPYVFVNMVCSVDGKSAAEGKASGIGTAADRRVMRTLRSKSDAVMIGGGTLRAEKLSLGLDPGDPRPRPLAVVLSAGGDVPLEANLVPDLGQKVLVLLSGDADEDAERRFGSLADVGRIPASEPGRVDLEKSLRMLKSRHGVGRLLVEGGPTLNHALISRDLVAELFVTLAPTLLGETPDDAPSILGGPLARPRHLRLLSALRRNGELFLRYALAASG